MNVYRAEVDPAVSSVPDVTVLEIQEVDGGCFLVQYADGRRYVGDSWHETYSDAVNQASRQYRTPETAWRRDSE